MKLCHGCDERKTLDAFHVDVSKRDGRATRCKACVNSRMKGKRATETAEQREARRTYAREYARTRAADRAETYRARRAAAIEALGGACSCCGETEPMFLTFDHEGEWGSEHRAADSTATSIVQWLHRRGYPADAGIRLLCWNCNCARGIYGSCPHED